MSRGPFNYFCIFFFGHFLPSLLDMQKTKTLNVATLANTHLNTWIAGSHIYKRYFFFFFFLE